MATAGWMNLMSHLDYHTRDAVLCDLFRGSLVVFHRELYGRPIWRLATQHCLPYERIMSEQHDHIHPEVAVAPGYLANHAARVFNRLVDTELRPYGLSLSLIGPIMLLSWKGSMLQRDLVRSSAVKQPAMVALLDKLETMTLIRRSPSPTDRRAALVELTENGHEAASRGRVALLAANAKGLEGFSADDATALVYLFQRLIENFER